GMSRVGGMASTGGEGVMGRWAGQWGFAPGVSCTPSRSVKMGRAHSLFPFRRPSLTSWPRRASPQLSLQSRPARRSTSSGWRRWLTGSGLRSSVLRPNDLYPHFTITFYDGDSGSTGGIPGDICYTDSSMPVRGGRPLELIDAPAGHAPFARLMRHLGYQVEVGVVVE